jgi:hypothetical protein
VCDLTRSLARWLVGIIGAVAVAFELTRAPIIQLLTLVIVLVTVAMNFRYFGTSITSRRRAAFRAIQLGMLLTTGLWVGLYLVVKFADSSADSPIPATFPIRFNGEEVGVAGILLHGLLSTAATGVLTLAVLIFRGHDASRSSSRSRHRTHRPKEPTV